MRYTVQYSGTLQFGLKVHRETAWLLLVFRVLGRFFKRLCDHLTTTDCELPSRRPGKYHFKRQAAVDNLNSPIVNSGIMDGVRLCVRATTSRQKYRRFGASNFSLNPSSITAKRQYLFLMWHISSFMGNLLCSSEKKITSVRPINAMSEFLYCNS